jgi:hypothetical protein
MKNKIILLTGFSLAVVLCVALPRALLAYDEIVVKDGGTIRGTVKLEGKVPKLMSFRSPRIGGKHRAVSAAQEFGPDPPYRSCIFPARSAAV